MYQISQNVWHRTVKCSHVGGRGSGKDATLSETSRIKKIIWSKLFPQTTQKVSKEEESTNRNEHAHKKQRIHWRLHEQKYKINCSCVTWIQVTNNLCLIIRFIFGQFVMKLCRGLGYGNNNVSFSLYMIYIDFKGIWVAVHLQTHRHFPNN